VGLRAGLDKRGYDHSKLFWCINMFFIFKESSNNVKHCKMCEHEHRLQIFKLVLRGIINVSANENSSPFFNKLF
jgi:Zn-finger protein